MPIVIDKVIDTHSLNYIYDETIRTPNWTLNRESGTKNNDKSFGGMSILGNYKIENSPFLCGYFISIYHKILANFNFNGLEKKVPLPKRIHIGAKYIGNVGTPHKDSDNFNETSILFFNNPFWKNEWGGGIVIDDNLIDYVPGRAVIFSSTSNHYVSPIISDEAPIRLAVNYMFEFNINNLGKVIQNGI